MEGTAVPEEGNYQMWGGVVSLGLCGVGGLCSITITGWVMTRRVGLRRDDTFSS